MKRILFLSLCVALIIQLQAQPPVQIEMGTVINAAGAPVSDGVMIYGAESLKKNVTYADVKGSPFLHEDFRLSLLYDAGNRLMGKTRSKINFYNYQVHYLDASGAEMSAGPQVVKRVVYVDSADHSKIQEEFASNVEMLNRKYNKPVFVKVLNSGDVRLIKYIQKNLGTYDSLMGQFKRYMFLTREDYYLQKQQTIEPLRKLNRENMLPFIRHELALLNYAEKEKLDFRKEADVISLLNYLNSLRVKTMSEQ